MPVKAHYEGAIDSLSAMKGTAVYDGFDDKATWSAAAAKNSGGFTGGAEPNRGPKNAGAASQPVQVPSPPNSAGPAHQLFIGIRGAVLAIDRTSGEVWRSQLKGKDFVNVVLEDGDVYAATQGELFCLDVSTGHLRWRTQLKGLGRGLVTIAGNRQTVVLKAKRQQEEEAADAGFLMMAAIM